MFLLVQGLVHRAERLPRRYAQWYTQWYTQWRNHWYTHCYTHWYTRQGDASASPPGLREEVILATTPYPQQTLDGIPKR